MKNTVIAILVVCVIVVGYIAAKSNLKMSIAGLEGKKEATIRGDLTLPINATGEVRPDYRIEIKSEASGEVVEIAKHGGDAVAAGDLLIRLQEDDEQRSVDRAQRDLDQAAARLEEARLNLKQVKTADLKSAKASVEQLKATVEFAMFRVNKYEGLPEDQRNPEEVLQAQTTYQSQLAQLASAEASLERATLAIPLAEQRVKQAAATYEAARTTLADAQKRLRETSIVSPIDGIVGDIRTQIGEVIQGGKTTLTGGTVLAVVLDVSKLLVRAEVDESDIGRVFKIAPEWAIPGHDSSVQVPTDLAAAAREAEHPPVITVESFRDEEFKGIIERIYPEPKSVSGVVTYLVDVVITSQNKDRLLPGMRADVRFTSEHVENVVLCPNEAIREGPGGELGVYIPKTGAPPEERETEFVTCKFGLDNGNYSEVVKGLAEGTKVYTKLPSKAPRDQ